MTKPDFAEMTRVFARIGMLSFGGPAGQIALMHRELVDERGWVGEGAFLRALNFCHLLPGPEAQQLATWIGWRLHGVRGGLVGGLLFVVPGAIAILALSMLYVMATGAAWFAAVFVGIKAAVLAIVAQAVIRIGRRALDSGLKLALAVVAFVALFALALPFPLVVLAAGGVGIITALVRPQWLGEKHLPDLDDASPDASWLATLRTVALWMAIWALPMIAVVVMLGDDHVLWRIGMFFSKLALVTFGGAYAVLGYMAQEAVVAERWLSAREMADGLGLAETTPGPLIMVTQFVGFLAAFRAPDPFSPMMAGVVAAALTTWVTFAPCFLWIFALAPWMGRLERVRWLAGGLAAITAAVVGVIANLGLWFALHVLFTQVRGIVPVWTSFDWRAGVLSALALVLVFVARRSVPVTLAVCAVAGLALMPW